MKIIVGLGNVGEKYLKNRHNCGFLVLDQFVKELEEAREKISWKEETKLKAITAKILYNNEAVLLVKPTTYMNRSGEAASAILNFFKESKENIIIIHDDIDLPLGKIRIRNEGSAGTHNGMKSVIEALGTKNFTRIRIGIESRGELTHKEQNLESFVLSDFTEKEIPLAKNAILEAVSELKKLISA